MLNYLSQFFFGSGSEISIIAGKLAFFRFLLWLL